MRTILVPVDLSEISTAVIERASCFAQSFASKLFLLHVVLPNHNAVPFNLDRDVLRREVARGLHDRRRQLYELAEQLRREHVDVAPRFISGTVSTTILSEADRIGADLIVMGSHGHGNVYHALFGGVGQKVVRKASCPVMLVSSPPLKPVWHMVRREAGASSEITPQ